MTAAGDALGLLVTGVALVCSLAVVWARWQVRDRRRRQARQAERAAMRDELEHERRRIRLRVVGGDGYCRCGAHTIDTPCYLGYGEVRS